MSKIVLTHKAQKDLRKLPRNIVESFYNWTVTVEKIGLEKTRKIPGYHDEPLHGKRAGQRSIRLNRSYRAFYIIDESGKIQIVQVLEINKHNY